MTTALLVVSAIGAAGAVAMFWTAAFTAKGGPAHRRAGRWFLRFLYVAAITGSLLAFFGLARPDLVRLDPAADPAGTRHFMGFVLYLSIILVAPAQHGLAAIGAGPVPLRVRSRWHLSLNLAAITGAVALFPASLIWRTWPFLLAVPAGFLIGLRNMAYAGARSAEPIRWEREHLTSLLAAGVVLHTAVFVIAASRWKVVPASWAWAPWLGPAMVGLPAILCVRRRWKGPGHARH